MRSRIAAALAIVLFLVLAGTGVSSALWSTNVTATGTVVAATLGTNCVTSQPHLANGSFEIDQTTGSVTQANPSAMKPWLTTDVANAIEVWRASAGVAVPTGNQFVELNANSDSTLYQSVATTPGETIRWSLLHRGRSGTDVMRVTLGGTVVNGVFTGGVSQGEFSASNAGWVRHEGVYTVPAGQTTTLFRMTSVSTATKDNTIGNFLEDVSFGTGPCIKAESTVTPASGVANSGDQLTYTTSLTNNGGNASGSSVYSTVLPAGVEYVANTAMVGTALAGSMATYDSATRTLSIRLGTGATASVGGSIAPDQTIVVNFKATVQPSAAGTTISYAATASYTDSFAPGWPKTATAASVTKDVALGADVAVSVLDTPNLIAASATANATWSFTVSNLGPAKATGLSVAVALPDYLTDAGTVVRRSTVNGATTAATVAGGTACSPADGAIRTCTIGELVSGESRVITVTRSITQQQKTVGASASFVATATATTSDPVATNNKATNTTTVKENTPPSVPTAPRLVSATLTQTNLAWTASTDNVGVAGYTIYRDGTEVGTSSTTSFSDTGLTSGTPYAYTIEAFDAAGNRSAKSTAFAASSAFDPAAVYRIVYPNATNLCLDQYVTNSITYVATDTCSTTQPLQNWRLVATTGANYKFAQAADTAKWWNLRSDSNDSGIQFGVNGDNNNAARATFSPVAVLHGAILKYTLVSTKSGLCADVNGQGVNPNTIIQQYPCNSSVAQFFTFTRVS